ncbi:MAG: PorP/SprF family type IX secretion system membrane protein [Chitinophagales bacterium]|nr:PorP/SprF family type IX secretion system membrane protein [Chitinophagales bacterium]
MNRAGKLLLSTAMLVAYSLMQAQDVRFSQPVNNPLVVNPSMMVLTNDLRVIFNYRNQWGNINKGYQSYAGSLLCPVFLKSKKDSVGSSRLDFGVNVHHEKAGAFKRTYGNLSFGYGLRINPANLVAASLNVGVVNHSINWNDQTFDEQYVWGAFNENNPTGENPQGSRANVDVGFGVMWHFTPEKAPVQVFAGVAGYHLNQPNLSFTGGSSKLPSRYNFQAGVKVMGKRVDFTPVFIYNLQGQFKQLTAGFLLAYKIEKAGNIVVGSWFKEKDAFVVQAGFEYRYFNLHYSYDFGNSALTRSTRGLMTHEATLAVKWDGIGKKANKGKAFF